MSVEDLRKRSSLGLILMRPPVRTIEDSLVEHIWTFSANWAIPRMMVWPNPGLSANWTLSPSRFNILDVFS